MPYSSYGKIGIQRTTKQAGKRYFLLFVVGKRIHTVRRYMARLGQGSRPI